MNKRFGFVFLCILIMLLLNPLTLSKANYCFCDECGQWSYNVKKDGTIELIGRCNYTEETTLEGNVFHTVGKYLDWDSIENQVIPEEIDGKIVTSLNGQNGAWDWRFGSAVVTIPNSVVEIKGNPFYSADWSPWVKRFEVAPDHPTLEVRDGCLIDKTEKRLIATSCDYVSSIPEGVEIVGEYSLIASERLEIPESVTTMEHGCFVVNGFDSKLKTIKIPKSVTKLIGNPFSGDRKIKISLENDHPTLEIVDNVLYDKIEHRLICAAVEQKNVVVQPGTAVIEKEAFADSSKLTTIMLPDSVESIGEEAFYRCSALKTVTIPEGVTTIASRTFCECSGLQNVTLSNNITSIGEVAFCGCSALKSITIPDSVTSIERSAFSYCSELQSITIPGSVSKIQPYTLYNCKKLKSIILGDGVKIILEGAFSDCQNLKTITIPDSIKAMEISFDREKVKAIVVKGSKAEKFCKKKKIEYSYADEK